MVHSNKIKSCFISTFFIIYCSICVLLLKMGKKNLNRVVLIAKWKPKTSRCDAKKKDKLKKLFGFQTKTIFDSFLSVEVLLTTAHMVK